MVRVFLARGLEAKTSRLRNKRLLLATGRCRATHPPSPRSAQPAGTPVVGAAAPLGAGARVVTTIDVNLRAEPAEDAEVVTILGQGVELEVTARLSMAGCR